MKLILILNANHMIKYMVFLVNNQGDPGASLIHSPRNSWAWNREVIRAPGSGDVRAPAHPDSSSGAF